MAFASCRSEREPGNREEEQLGVHRMDVADSGLEGRLEFSDGSQASFGYETATVIRVFSAESKNGAVHRAYLVEWQGQQVIVSDVLSDTDKKEGDELRFMVHELEPSDGDGSPATLQFQTFNFPWDE